MIDAENGAQTLMSSPSGCDCIVDKQESAPLKEPLVQQEVDNKAGHRGIPLPKQTCMENKTNPVEAPLPVGVTSSACRRCTEIGRYTKTGCLFLKACPYPQEARLKTRRTRTQVPNSWGSPHRPRHDDTGPWLLSTWHLS